MLVTVVNIGELEMAKKRKTAAAKARKTKTSAKKNRSAVKARRKVATPKKAAPKKATPKKTKSVAPKNAKPAAKKKPTGQPAAKQPENFLHKVAGAFEGVVDTLVDAEQLHHRLDPDPTRDLDPE
jgi:predicted lipid-binding transport protein (Tim44 family)